MSLRILRRWSTPDIDALTISLSIYWGLLLPIVCSQRSRVSMYKGLLTHSLLCSKFVELTLIYSFHMPLFMVISGYLFSGTIERYSFPCVLQSRFTKLLLPIFIWNSLFLLIQNFINFLIKKIIIKKNKNPLSKE